MLYYFRLIFAAPYSLRCWHLHRIADRCAETYLLQYKQCKGIQRNVCVCVLVCLTFAMKEDLFLALCL